MADNPDLGDVVREAKKAFGSLASDFAGAFQKVMDDAEYRIDKEVGRQMAKHPDLYAELKRTAKQFRRGVNKFAGEFRK